MKFLTLEQFTEMWKMQDQLNSKITPNWKEMGYNWNLYIKAEVMEFFEYIGYKHWKTPDQVKKPSDMQARLELVDIWHFLLSCIIETKAELNTIEYEWERFYNLIEESGPTTLEDCKYQVSRLDNKDMNNRRKALCLTDGLQLCEWSWEELYKAYIGKVALNAFRQDHGYKEGTYQKLWKTCEEETEEDNFFLEQILTELSLTPGALTYQAAYHKLGIEYMCRTHAQ